MIWGILIGIGIWQLVVCGMMILKEVKDLDDRTADLVNGGVPLWLTLLGFTICVKTYRQQTVRNWKSFFVGRAWISEIEYDTKHEYKWRLELRRFGKKRIFALRQNDAEQLVYYAKLKGWYRHSENGNEYNLKFSKRQVRDIVREWGE